MGREAAALGEEEVVELVPRSTGAVDLEGASLDVAVEAFAGPAGRRGGGGEKK